jgi:hypothetical protein
MDLAVAHSVWPMILECTTASHADFSNHPGCPDGLRGCRGIHLGSIIGSRDRRDGHPGSPDGLRGCHGGHLGCPAGSRGRREDHPGCLDVSHVRHEGHLECPAGSHGCRATHRHIPDRSASAFFIRFPVPRRLGRRPGGFLQTAAEGKSAPATH